MCALAVTDLPFVAGAHRYQQERRGCRSPAASNALAGTSQILDGELRRRRAAARRRHELRARRRSPRRVERRAGRQVRRGPLAAGVVYTCQVVLANPTSSRQRIAALVQIPRGSIPVAGARVTQTIDVALEAYGTRVLESVLPPAAPGAVEPLPRPRHAAPARRWSPPRRPARSRCERRAARPITPRGRTSRSAAPSPTSSPTSASQNLAATELSRTAWRLREPRRLRGDPRRASSGGAPTSRDPVGVRAPPPRRAAGPGVAARARRAPARRRARARH